MCEYCFQNPCQCVACLQINVVIDQRNAEMAAAIDKLKADSKTQLANEQSAWKKQLNQQAADWNALQSNVQDFYNTILNDIATLQSFDFDNLAALWNATRTTTFAQTAGLQTVAEIIKVTSTGIKIAQRNTTFKANGGVDQEYLVYKGDGAAVFKKATVATTFPADGSVKETLTNGYADWTLGAAANGIGLRDVTYSPVDGVFKFVYGDGTEKEVDLPIESLLFGVSYDSETHMLTFTREGGVVVEVPLTDLVDAYQGGETLSCVTRVEGGVIYVDMKTSAAADNTISVGADGVYVPPTVYAGS